MSHTKPVIVVSSEFLDQMNVFKQQLISSISEAVDEKDIEIKDIEGNVYVSYDDILSFITKIKIKTE